ncbi:MraY family glycosyltransferase [Algoriphagus vanfongensis]|uniref:MraY family glycosyltransferase n=1 Tax=Algoriphagus vanfongensis TaxID=426371 RepID=UPI000409CFE2|nr:glycosyltransferase family 4 protein [Algoriphagus vanfongensis]
MILSYLSIFLFLLLIGLVYYRLARKFGVWDLPNERSSHRQVTIRGGGILFPAAAIIWWLFFDFQNTWMIIGMLWISSISMLDDIYTLSAKLRFGVQFLALTMAFWDLEVFQTVDWYQLPILYFFGLGIINAINFMDGINGITGLYGLVFFASLMVVNTYSPFFQDELLHYEVLAICVFLLFNLRKKALMFAGDIGSITLAYLMIYFLTKWYLADGNWTIIMFLLIYGVDVTATFVRRIQKREKLTEPHRTHLYQFLVNQVKIDHVIIALVYALLQGAINFGFFILPQGYPEPRTAFAFMAVLGFAYLFFKNWIRKKYLLT